MLSNGEMRVRLAKVVSDFDSYAENAGIREETYRSIQSVIDSNSVIPD